MTVNPVAKILIIIGVIFILIGIGWQLGWIQQLRLGRLPGDIYIKKQNTTIFIPITTSILISLVFAIISWIFKK